MTVSRSRLTQLCAAAAAMVTVASCGQPAPVPPLTSAPTATTAPTTAAPVTTEPVVPTADFSRVSQLVNDAIAVPRLPGAVVQIGHGGNVVFRQAYGSRKLAGEPGLDGSPAPAEPMTEDTIFDLASLSKSLTTATAILQLYEQGKVQLDEPVQTYLPDFNPANDSRRGKVTVRMLLTHTSGLAGDLSLDGPWGLDKPDKAEGIHRALGAWVVFEPGERFHYSDIGFIILGALLEKITGEPEDIYIQNNVFAPLGMSDTRYLPVTKACGPHQIRGNALAFDPNAPRVAACPPGTWNTDLLTRVAPTALDEDTPGLNPDYGRPLRGTVHDPTARRMGGVAGSAGVFSTVNDVGRFAQALLDHLAGRPSTFPLTRASLELMTTPQQPGHHAGQLEAANNATDPRLAPHYPAIAGQDLRGFGWDIDTEQSRPRGRLFPVGSFGHTGFTGVTLWMDPGSDTYVVVLANVIHQRGGPPIAGLSGEIATAAARALHLYGT
ncbi:serine hydrolase domain-containing protein [Mycolicibacterium fortuitum]|uniref:Serine hydrolase domain-containing protein n=1 Tax=Mycolicibacterium fortuitum TaxID=1766 RepID=A0AAE4VGX7_MYCFO|nr:serine hydrolase domain-containing protein [Mycolicibacterium fortuitum]MCV7139468.1 beta-lactamase family protein [Mycolicibacterium fortuitum]MDV7193739.1 serine hydrolase domain-containing protein [Mycolicibacterium fortuitum]MDV7207148.1 serine hydrolase domain-containing protein [Mycolicibacterium fortuitum]MDV7228753.1 serine hydrolase domain-containing protein [Mycolicibacterium fortuitum]MDV7260750.1 serine hydrolase domain-containing protein [Mycolicibacterium fortuitum]